MARLTDKIEIIRTADKFSLTINDREFPPCGLLAIIHSVLHYFRYEDYVLSKVHCNHPGHDITVLPDKTW